MIKNPNDAHDAYAEPKNGIASKYGPAYAEGNRLRPTIISAKYQKPQNGQNSRMESQR